jgi:hypothetical protein
MFEELSSWPETATSPPLPPPEGPLSDIVTRAIVRPAGVHRDRLMKESVVDVLDGGIEDPLGDHDLQLALDLCFELHYLSFREVDPSWEWDPALIELRSHMEDRFIESLADEAGPAGSEQSPEAVCEALGSIEQGPASAELARYVEHDCSQQQMAELMVQRSAERLRRTDAYLWSIPRLTGRVRAALAAILRTDFPRDALFERALRAFGLDDRIGAYRDLFPAPALATSNLPTMLSLRRRARGAMAGHLVAQKLLGPEHDHACARAMHRLGISGEPAEYCETSATSAESMVELAVSELAGRLVADEPQLAADVMFGARSYVAVQERLAEWLLGCWKDGESSLRPEQAGFGGIQLG